MKSCLGIILFLLLFCVLGFTIFYNVSTNSSLHFTPKDEQSIYINTRRSFRPPAEEPATQPSMLPEGAEVLVAEDPDNEAP